MNKHALVAEKNKTKSMSSERNVEKSKRFPMILSQNLRGWCLYSQSNNCKKLFKISQCRTDLN